MAVTKTSGISLYLMLNAAVSCQILLNHSHQNKKKCKHT